MEFNTRYYEICHGASPRGQGNWAFCSEEDYRKVDYLPGVVWFRGTYSEAKAQAAKHFKGKTSVVVVCS